MWINKRKRRVDEKMKIFRAWLVAEERFLGILTPVVMTTSIRILSSICTSYGYEMWEMDVKTAILDRKS